MGIAALVVWVLTAGGGFYLLSKWVAGGGHRAGASTRFPPAVIFGHFLLAAAGLVLWIIHLITDNEPIGWIALIVLAPVALLGFAMLARWIPVYRSSHATAGVGTQRPGNPADAAPAERSFPVPIVIGHGALAVTTVVLVLLAMLGVGGR